MIVALSLPRAVLSIAADIVHELDGTGEDTLLGLWGSRLDAPLTNRQTSSAGVLGGRPTHHFISPSEKPQPVKPVDRPWPAIIFESPAPSGPVVSVETPNTPPSMTSNLEEVVVVDPIPHSTPPPSLQMLPRLTSALPTLAKASISLPLLPTLTTITPSSFVIPPVEQLVDSRYYEAIQHVPARSLVIRANTPRLPSAHKCPNNEGAQTMDSISSVSLNGSRAGPTGCKGRQRPTRSMPKPDKPECSKVTAAVIDQPGCRGCIVESSEYDAADSEDDLEWASINNTSEREREARAREADCLRQAAEEAQRQRDMFAKVPRRSYTTLPRTQLGLLSQLLNPDASVFPPDHPYRRGLLSQDMTQFGRQGHGAFTPLQTSKNSVALPEAEALVAQAPHTDGVHVSRVKGKDSAHAKKGRPQSMELEEYSDTEGETTDNGIQVSRSLAQQKLAALADSNRRRCSDRGPVPPDPPVRPHLPSVATAPMPLGHPYNLPAPAPPMTPRTTRRQMLSTELSESLRRNLLWERRVSRTNMMAPRRNGLPINGIRPPAFHDPARSNGGPGDKRECTQHVARGVGWADEYHYIGW